MSGIYICDTSPSLGIKIRGVRMSFKDKKLELTDQKDIEFMDKMLAEKPHISSIVRKLDMEAADKIAREHRAKMLALNAAHKGSATSVMEEAKRKAIEDEMLAKINMDDPETRAAVKALLEDDPNATQLETPDLSKVVETQKEKIEAQRKAEEEAKTNSETSQQSGQMKEAKPFSLKNLGQNK